MYHKCNTHESTASRNSLDEDAKLQNLATEYRENSSDDVKSFVIINDIDVDEELSKAQKDNKNFFQVLSMNFYGKVRSHSFDNREFRNQEKSQLTIRSDLKSTISTISRKGSVNSILERTSSTIKETKQKAPAIVKKNTLPVKGLEIVTEKLSKNLTSPKESSRKVSSPKTISKKNPVTGNLTAKASSKREPLFFLEATQKPQIVKKKSGDRVATSPDRKVSQSGQSTPHKGKKTGFSKLFKVSEKTPENIEERVQTLSVEPSTMEMRPTEFDESESEKNKNGEPSIQKEGKLVRKISSRAGSDKIPKDKAMLSSHSARVLGSPTKSQSKAAPKEVQKVNPEERLAKLELGDLQDFECRNPGSTKSQASKVKKNGDGQRSPESTKRTEKAIGGVGNVMGNQGMKIIIANKDGFNFRELKKSQSKEVNSSGVKSKKNSTGRLDKIDLVSPGKEKRVEEIMQGRQAKTPKFDGVKVEGEKCWKVMDVSDKMMKEKKDKIQPTSPASGEARKVLNFFDKLASLKKKDKI